MGEFSTYQVEGFKELTQNIKRLSKNMRDRALRKATKGAAMVAVYAAEHDAPRGRTGRLKAQIGAVVGKGRRGSAYDYRARVGVRYRDKAAEDKDTPIFIFGKSRTIIKSGAYYWRFQEFGTNHKDRKPIPALHFVENSLSENVPQITKIFFRHLEQEIARAGKK